LGIVLVLAVYILEPSMESIPALSAPANQTLLHALPSYWFLGIFQQLNGSMRVEFTQLARLGWVGFGLAASLALLAISLAYWRTLPRIVDEPEIRPAGPRWNWLLNPLGGSTESAVLFFSWRTLLRSRQHRMMFGFFLSIGIIVMLLYVLVPQAGEWKRPISSVTDVNFLIGTTMMTCLSVLGACIVVGVPSVLRANWIFRISQIDSPFAYRRATQLTLFTSGVVPAFVVSLLLLLWFGASWARFIHICALSAIGVALVNAVVVISHKLPFTCSWTPGKVNVLVTFFGGVIVGIPLASVVAKLELILLRASLGKELLIVGAVLLAAISEWLPRKVPGALKPLSFEEKDEPALVSLNLRRTSIRPE
jgi:hypothetical protein